MEGEGERRQEDKETPGEEDQRRKEGEGLQNVGGWNYVPGFCLLKWTYKHSPTHNHVPTLLRKSY